MKRIKTSIGFALPLVLLVLCVVSYFATDIPMTTHIDFSSIRSNVKSGRSNLDPKAVVASITENIKEVRARTSFINESRAREYVNSATNDYYRGSYAEALRRLDRAKIYDPSNYSIYKLSGQIFFEQRHYRKAFNSWERAVQLPNDDKTIVRDVDVVKRLLRHGRTEIDRLQQRLYRHPEDQIASARLSELREELSD